MTVAVYRAPMRSRRDDVDLGATIERALARGLCGFGGAKKPSDERAARRIERFRVSRMVRSSGPATQRACTGSVASKVRTSTTMMMEQPPSTWFMSANAVGWQNLSLSIGTRGSDSYVPRGGRNFQQTHDSTVGAESQELWDEFS